MIHNMIVDELQFQEAHADTTTKKSQEQAA